MKSIKLYFATNRAHQGEDQWRPDGYGSGFSSSGHQNLRFGYISVPYDARQIIKKFNGIAHKRKGDGEGLSKYFTSQSKKGSIVAFEDTSPRAKEELAHDKKASTEAFREIKCEMEKTKDVVIFIHGFNVDWHEAVGSALSLQCMLNRDNIIKGNQEDIMVILFSWPSDGKAIPWASYWSDRADAEASGKSIGRGLLTLRTFLQKLRKEADAQHDVLCHQNIHLLCHSMGNFALQNALQKMIEESPRLALPRIFHQIFLCAPDVDDNVLEPGQPMERLHELCLNVSVYFNSGDVALGVSDITKGNPDRLGQIGMSRESYVHRKVHEIDCSKIVGGVAEHSYYLWATVNNDIRQSIDEMEFEDSKRKRLTKSRNSCAME